MLRNNILYSYNDVMIQPAMISKVESRSQCNPYKNGKLPIFTAPMSTVVDENNFETFDKNGIIPILPRNIKFQTRYNYALRGLWAAFSLNEFKEHFCNPMAINYSIDTWKVLIDVANGHMKQLYDAVKMAKSINGDKICIMIGNIANPQTYYEAYLAGADLVRVGIGSGSGCITSSNTGIHYPMASLVNDCYNMKLSIYNSNNHLNKTWEQMPKIIADGGIRNYSDVNKALSLGSDYVMAGSVLASLIESAGETFELKKDGSRYYYKKSNNINYEEFLKMKPNTLYKEFYGMASKEGQIDINGKKTKTSEGIKKDIPITGSIQSWSKNMADYLRSVMSYCNIFDIKDFNPKNVIVNLISTETKNSINK